MPSSSKGRGASIAGLADDGGCSQSIGSGMYPEETVAETFGKGAVRTRGVIAPKAWQSLWKAVSRQRQWPFASGGPSPISSTEIASSWSMASRCLANLVRKQSSRWCRRRTSNSRHLAHDRHAGHDSCDVRVKDVFVPKSRTFNLMDAQTCFDTPVARLPLRVALSFPHSALAIGIAQGALDDIVDLAAAKSRSMKSGAAYRRCAPVRHELGRCSVRLVAARAMLDRTPNSAGRREPKGGN